MDLFNFAASTESSKASVFYSPLAKPVSGILSTTSSPVFGAGSEQFFAKTLHESSSAFAENSAKVKLPDSPGIKNLAENSISVLMNAIENSASRLKDSRRSSNPQILKSSSIPHIPPKSQIRGPEKSSSSSQIRPKSKIGIPEDLAKPILRKNGSEDNPVGGIYRQISVVEGSLSTAEDSVDSFSLMKDGSLRKDEPLVEQHYDPLLASLLMWDEPPVKVGDTFASSNPIKPRRSFIVGEFAEAPIKEDDTVQFLMKDEDSSVAENSENSVACSTEEKLDEKSPGVSKTSDEDDIKKSPDCTDSPRNSSESEKVGSSSSDKPLYFANPLVGV